MPCKSEMNDTILANAQSAQTILKYLYLFFASRFKTFEGYSFILFSKYTEVNEILFLK